MKKFLVATVLFSASVFGLTAGVQAGETFLLFEDDDDLPPPYKQWWYATVSDESYSFGPEVFIRGTGKRGEFFGIVMVDCLNPENFEWIATGGFLNSEAVPAQAINELRLEICSQSDPS
ncbi:MAG: hypothetical protein ACSHWY_07825 [Octadecabacter sp.]